MMLFDAMNENSRIVEVYDKVVTYKFEDGQAFRMTTNGALIPVEYNVAMQEIERYKERDGKHYRSDLPAPGFIRMRPAAFGWLLIIVTAFLSLLLLIGGYLL